MKLVLVSIYVITVLGSAFYVRAAAYEWEQFHDGYEEQQDPEIGESPKDNAGYGKKVNINTQTQSSAGVSKKEKTLPLQKESPFSREEGFASQSSNAGRRGSSIAGVGFQKSAKEHLKSRSDHFDHEGHEEDKLHGEYDHRAERPNKSDASKAW